MSYIVELYEKDNGRTPVLEFLQGLNAKQGDKVSRAIDLLGSRGDKLYFPDVDTIKGKKYQGLWELRVLFASDIFRVFYYFADEDTVVLLHGIVKKQQKTPAKELDVALNRMNDDIWRKKQ